MTDDKKNPLGPTGSRVQANLARIREARGLTKKDLSARVGELGRPIPPLGISRIEAGARRVDADDLVALALALNVSPLSLLLPPEDLGGQVDLTAHVSTSFDNAWEWAGGERALAPSGIEDEQKQDDYERLSLSVHEWRLRRHPADRAAQRLRSDVRQLVKFAGWAMDGLDEEFDRRVNAVHADLDRLPAELDRIKVEHDDLVRYRAERVKERKAKGGS